MSGPYDVLSINIFYVLRKFKGKPENMAILMTVVARDQNIEAGYFYAP